MPHDDVVIRRLAVVLVVAGLSGCGSGNLPVSAPAPTVTVTVTAAAPTSPASSASGALSEGTVFATSYAEVTVLGYDNSVKVGGGSTTIQTLLVKTCVKSLPADEQDGLTLGWDPWTLVDADSTRHEPASDRWDHVGSQYPDDQKFKVGECAKGVIQFDQTKDKSTARTARYANGDGESAVWTL